MSMSPPMAIARDRLSLLLQTYGELVGRGRSERPFATLPIADAARYCAADSEMVLRLEAAFRPELEDHELVRLLEALPPAAEVESKLARVRADVEERRARLAELRAQAQALAREAELAQRRLHAIVTERGGWAERRRRPGHL